ncbi:MAG: Flp pilus assembly protein TadD [Motiliproteus sp.]|jgi:Flp pilus assembly protein TadD
MSLVNEMLRDLDKRRRTSPEAQAPSVRRAPAPTRLQSASGTSLGVWVLALALACAAGLWLYHYSQSGPHAQSEPVASAFGLLATTSDLPAAEQTATITKAEPQVQIIGVEWIRQPLLELQLTLNQAPTQQVLTSTSRSLHLDLGPVGLDLELPVPDSGLIRLVQFVNNNGHLTLALETQQDVSFRIFARNGDNQHRLVLSIAPQPQPTPASMAKVPPVVGVEVANSVTARPEKARAQSIGVNQPSSAAQVSAQAESEHIPVPPVAWRKTALKSLEQRDQAAVVQALAKVQSRQSPQARQLLEALLLQDPNAFSSRTLLASLYIGEQQLDQAEQLITAGLALDPNHAGLRKLRARLLIQEGALPAAIRLLSGSQPEVKADPEFHQLRAAALQAAGEHQQAAEAYHHLLQTRADEPRWWIGLALSLEALKKPQQAKQAYHNVFKIPQLAPTLADFVSQRLVQLGG